MVQAMAWCRQATSHYISQCWPRSLAPYGVTMPQWVTLILQITYYMWYEFVPVMAWCPLDNKPLTEPMMTKIKCSKSGCMCIKIIENMIFIWNSWWFWYSWPTILKYVYKHNNSQTCALRMNRQVCTGWALGVHWVIIRCALGEH